MPREVAPQISGRRLVHIRHAFLQRNVIARPTLIVVRALLAAVVDLPGLLGVVAGDGRSGPHVPVAGNFAAVVKVVDHAKLPRQLVLVGRDRLAVHRQRRVAVALANVAEDLVVGAVLFNDVDDVANGIRAVMKGDLARATRDLIAAHDLRRKLIAASLSIWKIHARNRSVEHRCDVLMRPSSWLPALIRRNSIGPGALTLPGGDQ